MKKDCKRMLSMALALTVCAAPMLFVSCAPTSPAGSSDDSHGESPNSSALHSNETTAPDTPNTTEPETTRHEPVSSEVTVKLRVGSYNIKHGADAGGNLTKIADTIKNAGLDICGVQEVDYMTTRCGGVDQPAELAAASGLEYYRYTPAIDYQGGKYGTLILSRYPIESFEYTELNSGGKEQRAIGHAVINVNGTKIDFFNTHLSYESKGLRIMQFKQISHMLEVCENYILTADFNTQEFSEFDALGYGSIVNNDEHRFVTFPGSSSAIDNIVLSDGFAVHNTATVPQSYSDHRMLYSDISLSVRTEE